MFNDQHAQVILATGISFGAMLHDRFGLPIIRDRGGIPPGNWYVLYWIRCFCTVCSSVILVSK